MKYIRQSVSDNMITVLLCHQLLLENIKFDVEYSPKIPINPDLYEKNKIPIPKGTTNRRKLERSRKALIRNKKRRVRFDIVIIRDAVIVAIIETKSTKQKAINQLKRYSSFGIPVHLCCGEDGITNALSFAKQHYYKNETTSFLN